MEINEIFDRLYDFYEVSTITDLAAKLEMSQPAITNWQRRNSISAIKKRCRELGIYNKIFDDFNLSHNKINMDNFYLDMLSYYNISVKKIIKDWGVEGYGMVVGTVLYLKEHHILDVKDIDLLADDLKASTFKLSKVIEECNFFINENSQIRLSSII